MASFDVLSYTMRRREAIEREALRLHHAQQVATLTGERDAARRECAELRAQVAGLEARVTQLVEDRQFYYQLFQDAQRQEVR